jgi:hypothetical protein
MIDSESKKLILWRVDLLLGNDREVSNYTEAKQEPRNSVFYSVRTEML